MRGELVALDLETTGLDPVTDAIVEIGMVRINEGQITGEFSTLVNPGFQIPAQATYISGIRTEDVLKAPSIEQVLPEITAFVNTAPIIAHNTQLDMGFLRQRYGILRHNLTIDTYELATIVLPRAPRYTLSSLAQQLGIELRQAHRALDDARAAAQLYWILWEKIQGLPALLLQEITSAGRDLNWDAGQVFLMALKEGRSSSAELLQSTPPGPVLEPFSPLTESSGRQSLQRPLDADAVVQLLDASGPIARIMTSYEDRPQQKEMALAIAEAFGAQRNLIIEADTGTGKTLAYLVPAILWATSNQEQVVISTHTITLQDQLINHVIPIISSALSNNFRAAVLKGRSNYLCPRRLSALRRRRPTSIDELRTLAKILVWLLESKTGDKSEISLRGPAENTVWQRLSAQDEDCSLNRCWSTMQGMCPFYKARKAAEAAHLIVVNHALLISDANSEQQVLPDYQYVVIDEAHQLEDAITNSLSIWLDQAILQRRLADLGGPARGLSGEILMSIQGHIPEKEASRLRRFIETIHEATTLMDVHVKAYFERLHGFVTDLQPRPGDYTTLVRIDNTHRDRPAFAHIQSAWSVLSEFFAVIGEAMRRLTHALVHLQGHGIPNYDDLVSSAETAARHLDEIRSFVHHFTMEPDDNTIYWLNLGQITGDNLAICSAPLHVGPLVEKHLWRGKKSVILTSATLLARGQFDYLQDRLNAEAITTLELSSPFNYRDSTLVYVPTDIPEPNDRQNYQRAVERGIIELATALDGRVLALFTSYTQLRQTAQSIIPRLALGNIIVYDQSDGSSRETLLEGFKSAEKAVLLGTRSFWEGVDIPGESLSALVIVRLPFAVPTDPIFAARSETYSDAFNDFTVPEAILRFRQGFGRLIRVRTDRGVVAIFDSRVLSKSYGASFLEALPDCTMKNGPLEALPDLARKWLQREKL